MGLPMAHRLLAAGHQVFAWNRSRAKLDALCADGAIAAGSPSEVMAQAGLIGLCLTSHQAVEEVAWGTEGLFSRPVVGRKYVADFSTGSHTAAQSFSNRAAAHDTVWVDAPVSGGVPAAIAGKLIIFAGGEYEAIAAMQPLFGPLAARVTRMGPAGAGQVSKICNQMVVASTVLVIAEMIALARKTCLDVEALPEALRGGFADSPLLQIFGPRMAARNFEPRLGAIALMAKDAALASALAAEVNANIPMLERAAEIYASTKARGVVDMEADISRIVDLFDLASQVAAK
jgi:3-hydroxyisobutyrate dehydrogenase-like beta-hydroxyacid dehydrogenase